MSNKIYFTSDLHFCHDRNFVYEPRGFSSIEEMNETVIENFNKTIHCTDDLYILGDCFLNNNIKGLELMRRLPGIKHIIWGNHDTDTRKELIKSEGYDCIGYSTILKHKKFNLYLCHFPTSTTNLDDWKKPLKKRVLSICGHTHSKELFEYTHSYNVALDAHNNFPVSFDEIVEAFKEKYKQVENN